ncbi:hypothetical protein BHE74_00021622, partial [Ensete ventricosum]
RRESSAVRGYGIEGALRQWLRLLRKLRDARPLLQVLPRPLPQGVARDVGAVSCRRGGRGRDQESCGGGRGVFCGEPVVLLGRGAGQGGGAVRAVPREGEAEREVRVPLREDVLRRAPAVGDPRLLVRP